MFKTIAPITVHGFQGNCPRPEPFRDFTLPAGLQCIPSSWPGKFYLTEFPFAVFPKGSALRFEAMYHGILLDASQVTEVDYAQLCPGLDSAAQD